MAAKRDYSGTRRLTIRDDDLSLRGQLDEITTLTGEPNLATVIRRLVAAELNRLRGKG